MWFTLVWLLSESAHHMISYVTVPFSFLGLQYVPPFIKRVKTDCHTVSNSMSFTRLCIHVTKVTWTRGKKWILQIFLLFLHWLHNRNPHYFSLDVYVIYPNYVQLVNVEFLFLKIVVVRLHSLFAVLLGKTIMLVFLLCYVIGETVDNDVSIWKHCSSWYQVLVFSLHP